MHILTPEQIKNLLAQASKTNYYELIHTALCTGLRRNELLGLRWGDVDFDTGVVSVTRSIYRDKGGTTLDQQPKTAKGQRAIDLPDKSLSLLEQYRQNQNIAGMLRGYAVENSSPIFRNLDGTAMLPTTVSHAFHKIVEHSGIPEFRFHDIRHTHATLMLKLGEHPKIVQERLGHAKIATTMDTYSHVMPTLQKEAAARFNLALETLTPDPVSD